MKMRFREDGTFKIMQITDMQEIPAISKDTIALMERAILRSSRILSSTLVIRSRAMV